MLHEFALPVEFFAFLFEFDEEIARRVAAAGCPRCGGPLHRADYGRKPRGGRFATAAEAFTLRHSLCCGREGCRRRALPPSVRFLGRRVYTGAVVLLASVVAQVVSAIRAARSVTGVPGRTLRRWGSWWRSTFPGTPTWIELRARFVPPPPDESELPRSFVARLDAEIGGSLGDVCAMAARLLATATTASVPDCARFVREISSRATPG